MKLHRVFIAIHVPEEVKEQLLAFKEKWPELPAKWTARENLHITLAFLGNRSDKELAETYELVQKIGERHKPFSVQLNKIVYGPSEINPKMIWAMGERSPELIDLQQDLESTLHLESNNSFVPHLTLAKLSAFRFRKMELEELPEVNEEVSLSFTVNAIEIMESTPKRSGSHYTILKSVPL